MKQHRGFPQSEELVSPFLFKYYLIPWFPITPSLYKSVKRRAEQSRVLATGDQRLPAVSFAYCLVDISICTLFWKNLLNATFIYSWSFTPENDYQAVSLFLFKHLIHHTHLFAGFTLAAQYIDAHHIYVRTQTHTGTRTTAHAGNICNLHLFVCSPHSCWIIS